jgi:Transglutaminase-like superfamily
VTRAFSRFIALDRSQRRLVIEAAALLALVGAAMSVGGFARSRPLLERCARNRKASRTSAPGETFRTSIEPSTVAWAVTAAATRFPFWHTCLVKALVTDLMLRRRGMPSSIFVGVRRGQIESIDAHAWVESGGAVVIGALDDLGDFTVLSGARLL